jgi:hypothetical protein
MSASPISNSFLAYPAPRPLRDLCDFDFISLRPSYLASHIYNIRYRSFCFAVKNLSPSSSFKNHQSSIINRQSNRSIKRIHLYKSLPLLFIFLSSCADKPAEIPAPKTKEEQARLVGRIASIHKNPNFALIQSYGIWTIQTGAILATIGPDGRAANLKVTGEKTGQFAAADIQSGTLEIGDSVHTTLSSVSIEEAAD